MGRKPAVIWVVLSNVNSKNKGSVEKMWYFSWILGVLLACAFGIINVMWMETEEILGSEPEEH